MGFYGSTQSDSSIFDRYIYMYGQACKINKLTPLKPKLRIVANILRSLKSEAEASPITNYYFLNLRSRIADGIKEISRYEAFWRAEIDPSFIISSIFFYVTSFSLKPEKKTTPYILRVIRILVEFHIRCLVVFAVVIRTQEEPFCGDVSMNVRNYWTYCVPYKPSVWQIPQMMLSQGTQKGEKGKLVEEIAVNLPDIHHFHDLWIRAMKMFGSVRENRADEEKYSFMKNQFHYIMPGGFKPGDVEAIWPPNQHWYDAKILSTDDDGQEKSG
ncbi:hypothetical protein CAPTEDRAFT_198118 [Capitella teleta]|uniref:Uncharacterized protein n=1 Tax=Capitella teleta TaxID=283909 RepID=X1ZYB0_CAPTE|nr:hypothetical protein CAPTEDRAFT_198118 [Capitella teleta]|eukprot:ELU04668.1 hypothetical protein CAPTEDRAFT_198118 [Capitella teleta]